MKTENQNVSVGREGAPVVLSLEYIQAKKDWARFGGASKAEFETKLRAMSDCDLSNYLSKMGLRPSGERRVMIMAMLKKYDECSQIFKRQESISHSTPSAQVQSTKDNYEQFIANFRTS